MIHFFSVHFLMSSLDKHNTSESSSIGYMEFYKNLKVAIGFIASIMLFAIMAWMLHDSYPRMFKTRVTSPSILELMWVSAHSTILQDVMARADKSMSDQLRIEGIKTEVCLLNLDIESTHCQSAKESSLELSSTAHLPNWQQFVAQGQFSILQVYNAFQIVISFAGQASMHLWCYVLHGILFSLHVILILFLIHHPEHAITMSVYSTWVTTILSVCLQAFYVVS